MGASSFREFSRNAPLAFYFLGLLASVWLTKDSDISRGDAEGAGGRVGNGIQLGG